MPGGIVGRAGLTGLEGPGVGALAELRAHLEAEAHTRAFLAGDQSAARWNF